MLKECKGLRSLQKLSPFLMFGMLKVGGRQQYFTMSFQQKYPILLSHKHPVTDLIIQQCHDKEVHMGMNHVLPELNGKF